MTTDCLLDGREEEKTGKGIAKKRPSDWVTISEKIYLISLTNIRLSYFIDRRRFISSWSARFAEWFFDRESQIGLKWSSFFNSSPEPLPRYQIDENWALVVRSMMMIAFWLKRARFLNIFPPRANFGNNNKSSSSLPSLRTAGMDDDDSAVAFCSSFISLSVFLLLLLLFISRMRRCYKS